MAFQSTRPLRGGTCRSERMEMQRGISIHPPLAGRDQEEEMTAWQRRISIHPPLAGRDAAPAEAPAVGCDFNPPAPCGAGRSCVEHINIHFIISIHPPLAGRD